LTSPTVADGLSSLFRYHIHWFSDRQLEGFGFRCNLSFPESPSLVFPVVESAGMRNESPSDLGDYAMSFKFVWGRNRG
jgi:hypothetical protein